MSLIMKMQTNCKIGVIETFPFASFRKSCWDISLEEIESGTRIKATCNKKRNQGFETSTLDIPTGWKNDVSNCNGFLSTTGCW
jgi:hypothetical protein